jgi:hypothetical protein
MAFRRWPPRAAAKASRGAQLLLGDPCGEELVAPIVVDAAVPHMRERLVRQAFPRAQQQPPVTKVESGVAEPVPDVHHLAGVPGWHRVPVGAKRDQGLV